MVGCAGKAAKTDEKKKEDPKKDESKETHRLYTGSGSLLVREPNGGPIRYKIRWKGSQVDYTQEQGARSGRLDKVTGELYQDNKLASTFSADTGYADQTSKLLRLEGHVIVEGIEPKSTMHCERMSWKTDEKLLKAYGNVTIQLDQGLVGPIEELWCLPGLKTAGTPGFGK